MPGNHRIAALFGNGVSIAFNPDLAIGKINESIREDLNKNVSAGDPASVLTAAANKINTGDAYSDFEALLGPLDAQQGFLKMMADYASIIGKENIAAYDHLIGAADFIKDVRRSGTGFALEVIADRSRASQDQMEGLYKFMDAVIAASGGSRVTIGNLNYDSLIMAALAEQHSSLFCDMTDARYSLKSFDVVDAWPFSGRPLRMSPHFPDRQIRLLHLHGSLAWLKNPEDGKVYRFAIDDLRTGDFWEEWREGRTDWQPQVVLTNQSAKNDVVKQPPFSMGYEVFEQALVNSDRWLIAGYSFRDECVNEMLSRAWDKRTSAPQIFVIAYGKDPMKDQVLKAIGHHAFVGPEAKTFLTIDRSGVERAIDGFDWAMWSYIPKKAA